MSDQLVAEAATYTTHTKQRRQTAMPSAGFEPAIPAMDRLQTYVLDRTVTTIGYVCILLGILFIPLRFTPLYNFELGFEIV